MVRTRSQRIEKEEKDPGDRRTRSRTTGTQSTPASTRPKPQPSNAKASSSGIQSNPSIDSSWVSRVRAGSQIAKTAALAQYKLKPADLEDLKYVEVPNKVSAFYRASHQYMERDVEKKAWELYGGPEKFEEKLDELRKEHERKKLKGSFQAPAAYSSRGQGASITIERLSPPPAGYKFDWATYEPFVDTSPVLQGIKATMVPWLWRECMSAINEHNLMDEGVQGMSQRDREKAMQEAVRDLTNKYPPRPAEPLPSSPAVDALRAVLEEAPAYPPEQQLGEEFDNLDMSGDTWPDFEPYFEWSRDYVGRIFRALQDIIDTYGMGDQGWATARWEIYEVYKKKMTSGIGCNFHSQTRKWYDGAAKWLQEEWLKKGLREHCGTVPGQRAVAGSSQTSSKGKSVAR